MDRVNRSNELESPACPNCGGKMHWCGSELVKFVPLTNLHLFTCQTCLLLAESETVREPVWVAAGEIAVSSVRFFALAA